MKEFSDKAEVKAVAPGGVAVPVSKPAVAAAQAPVKKPTKPAAAKAPTKPSSSKGVSCVVVVVVVVVVV